MGNKGNKVEELSNLTVDHPDFFVRNSRLEDVERLVELARLSFNPSEIAFTKGNFCRQIETFPEGQICVEYKGDIIGSCSSVIVNIEDYPKEHTLKEISDNGNIQNHNVNGKHLYGIDVIVHPNFRQRKIGKRLYEARKQVCKKLDLQSIIYGGRIPYYQKYAETMAVEDYVDKVIEGKIYDPVLTFQLKNGFQFKHIMPNYLPTDSESMFYATFMEWKTGSIK
ncbi:GNAT family N-acetyltransferase [Bacillus sp. FJAT-29790]|uniref:GNAT family N-acetyltransferase n=1 Tax=Bacillus sp. FJAT-29790 TaxID=1895002 RepID=UPI001C21FB0E|nr:GNAT family N-acetyltransferase [Bacillus sp. FJAT-29790]MBU8877519.1 GNAT family N-acetyltransferase [Bacillus sp. FJAT-29790]